MRYVLQVVLSNAQHPEYGQATIPFPIPNQNYDSTIELLGPLEIGDIWNQMESRLRKCIGLVRWPILTGQALRWCWK